MQLVNFAIAFLVYYPFFRMWDKQKLEEKNAIENISSNDQKVAHM